MTQDGQERLNIALGHIQDSEKMPQNSMTQNTTSEKTTRTCKEQNRFTKDNKRTRHKTRTKGKKNKAKFHKCFKITDTCIYYISINCQTNVSIYYANVSKSFIEVKKMSPYGNLLAVLVAHPTYVICFVSTFSLSQASRVPQLLNKGI